jgi:hypothetical protein
MRVIQSESRAPLRVAAKRLVVVSSRTVSERTEGFGISTMLLSTPGGTRTYRQNLLNQRIYVNNTSQIHEALQNALQIPRFLPIPPPPSTPICKRSSNGGPNYQIQ